MVAIGQEAVSGSQYTLQIGAAEIAGRAGCNSFSAPYTAAGDTLTVGAARSTRMACAPGVMTREQRALAILSGAVRVSRPDATTLVLTGDEGAIRLRRAQLRAIVLALLLAGCATVPEAEPESYRALGTEPFWSITIENGRMTYSTPDGGFSIRAPRGQELGDGRLWETRRITLQSSNQECSDGMSDNRYAQTVRAVVDGRTLEGCGGDLTQARPN